MVIFLVKVLMIYRVLYVKIYDIILKNIIYSYIIGINNYKIELIIYICD